MTDWLDNPNSVVKKAGRNFDISAEDEAKLRQKDAEAREEYEKQKKKQNKNPLRQAKSRKEEAFRIGGKALRELLMKLLAELVREIVAKMVKWFKSSKKALDTLLDSLKEAIRSFIGKMKQHLINAGNTLLPLLQQLL